MEHTLDCSLERQTYLAQEERNTRLNTQGRVRRLWNALGRRINQTHLRDQTRQEVGNRHMGISKQEGKH